MCQVAMLTILDPANIRPSGGDPGVELLLDPGVLLEHGDEGAAQDAAQLALQVRPHVLRVGREYCSTNKVQLFSNPLY